jgi:hypothetical protein
MTIFTVQNGASIAPAVRTVSENCLVQPVTPNTVGELLDILCGGPLPELPVLKTTCSRLTDYLGIQINQLTIDMVNESRDGFRTFLEGRHYKENAVRSYVNHARILLKHAKGQGWKPGEFVPEAWKTVFAHRTSVGCRRMLRHFSRCTADPRLVTIEQVETWADEAVVRGNLSFKAARTAQIKFWRLLRECSCNGQTPALSLSRGHRSVKVEQLPEKLREELLKLLKWKQAEFSIGRPKGSRIRPVTANTLSMMFRYLYYFASNVVGRTEVCSLAQIVEKDLVSAYVEWCINDRMMNGYSLQCQLRLLFASVRQYPPLSGLDLRWSKELNDSIPVESKSEQNLRKAQKCPSYASLQMIPAKIQILRSEARNLDARRIAELAMHELLVLWLLILPWRQKNLRECRISKPVPNLFKAIIPAFGVIDKPGWINEEQARDPGAQFWQFDFSPSETKPKRRIQAAVPKQLIPLLEEYLLHHRPNLVKDTDPGTLFITADGRAFNKASVNDIVSTLTLRFGGKRVTPHLYRDVVAFAWLKAHPKDYLTVSKHLWHSSIAITIETYGSQFNESSAACAMEAWLEESAAKSK